MQGQQANNALHPTVFSSGFPLVPRSKPALPAAGELGVLLPEPVMVAIAIFLGISQQLILSLSSFSSHL